MLKADSRSALSAFLRSKKGYFTPTSNNQLKDEIDVQLNDISEQLSQLQSAIEAQNKAIKTLITEIGE